MRRGPMVLIVAAAALLAGLGMWWTAPDLSISTAPRPHPDQGTPAAAAPASRAPASAALSPPAPTPRAPDAPAEVTFEPPDPPDWVDVSTVHASGSLRDVAVGLKEHEHRVRDCYEQWAAVHGHVHGKLQFEVTVPAGTAGEVVAPQASNVWAVAEVESLEACANDALADLKFSASDRPTSMVWQVP